ncbi:MAG TPA: YfhO family protein [Anaerolineae bacterium]|nr:YfhO family protein [Anaerolineae bacterium]
MNRRWLTRLRLVHLSLLAPWLLLAPALWTGRALFWGTPVLQFYPWRWWGWMALQQGVPPLWNPLVGMGAPLAANHQSAFFYPLAWLPLLLGAVGGRAALVWGHALLAAVHLTLAAWGMGRLARSLGLTELGQALAALAYALSGYLVARLGFFSINAATAWVPWVLWGVRQVVRHPHRRVVAGLALALGLQWLAGHAQTAWYTDLLAVLWAVFLLWREGRRLWPRRIAALALALLGGVALAAVQLVPTAEYLVQSQRATGVDPEVGLVYSFWPWHLLNFLAPETFGNPAFGDYWGYANYWEDAVYLGLLPLLLAGWAVRRRLRSYLQGAPPAASTEEDTAEQDKGPSLALFWAGVVLLGMGLALGKHSPLFMFLWRHVPTFDFFRGPTRWSLWAEVGLALLAGMGASCWCRPAPRGVYALRLTAAGAGMVTGTALLLGLLAPQVVRSVTLLRGAALFGVMLGVVVVFTLKAPPAPLRGADSPWAWAVVVAVGLDLLAAGWGLNPTLPMKELTEGRAEVVKVRQIVGAGRLFLPPAEEERLKFRCYFRFDTFWPPHGWSDLTASLLPNLTLWAEVPSANNFDPLVPARYAAWLAAWEEQPPQVRSRWLARMGVTVLQRVDFADACMVTFHPVPSAEPLARWVPLAYAVPDGPAALEAMTRRAAQGGPAWQRAIVVETPGSQTLYLAPLVPYEAKADPPTATGRVEVLRRAPLGAVYRLETSQAGWLFLAETWYPGWRAWVDDQPAPLLRAEYLFRAVPVPPGVHEVRVAYRPWWWPGVALLSALAALALLGAGGVGRLPTRIPWKRTPV